MLDRLEAEEARHAHHRGAAVEELLLLVEGTRGRRLGVAAVGDERAADDEHRDDGDADGDRHRQACC